MTTLDVQTTGAYQPFAAVDVGTGQLIYISGLTSGEELAHDIVGQSTLIFQKMEQILRGCGGSLENMVKLNAYIVDIHEYDAYNGIRNRFFGSNPKKPASATIGGARLLRPGNRIEIDAVAFVPSG
ncbi:MAG: RidA family protein [Burkholderiaceae bacterium]